MHPASPPTALVANPSADVYGSDLQMLESVAGLRERGWRVVVALPGDGPLLPRLLDLGAEVQVMDFPVLRRESASPAGLLRLGIVVTRALPRMLAGIRRERPDLVYVNTLTLPLWLLAARATRVPVLCHVHEAEEADPPAVRRALATPLALAHAVMVNSHTTERTVLSSAPRLRSRTHVVVNGVGGPPSTPTRPPRHRSGAWRLVVVGRLSARKAPDVALEAAALLRSRGHAVELDLCGTPGPGQEEYVAGLEARADQPDLRGAVRFRGYTAPVWRALEEADVVLAPSLGESFGNAVVEAQRASRPVVATAVQGHCETVADGVTGLLVPTRDPQALANAVERLLDDRVLADRLTVDGERSARAQFGLDRYRHEVVDLAERLTGVPAQAR